MIIDMSYDLLDKFDMIFESKNESNPNQHMYNAMFEADTQTSKKKNTETNQAIMSAIEAAFDTTNTPSGNRGALFRQIFGQNADAHEITVNIGGEDYYIVMDSSAKKAISIDDNKITLNVKYLAYNAKQKLKKSELEEATHITSRNIDSARSVFQKVLNGMLDYIKNTLQNNPDETVPTAAEREEMERQKEQDKQNQYADRIVANYISELDKDLAAIKDERQSNPDMSEQDIAQKKQEAVDKQKAAVDKNVQNKRSKLTEEQGDDIKKKLEEYADKYDMGDAKNEDVPDESGDDTKPDSDDTPEPPEHDVDEDYEKLRDQWIAGLDKHLEYLGKKEYKTDDEATAAKNDVLKNKFFPVIDGYAKDNKFKKPEYAEQLKQDFQKHADEYKLNTSANPPEATEPGKDTKEPAKDMDQNDMLRSMINDYKRNYSAVARNEAEDCIDESNGDVDEEQLEEQLNELVEKYKEAVTKPYDGKLDENTEHQIERFVLKDMNNAIRNRQKELGFGQNGQNGQDGDAPGEDDFTMGGDDDKDKDQDKDNDKKEGGGIKGYLKQAYNGVKGAGNSVIKNYTF